jgi:hypothetical protein
MIYADAKLTRNVTNTANEGGSGQTRVIVGARSMCRDGGALSHVFRPVLLSRG